MNLISNENSNKLGDSCKKQISVKCFFILGFTIRNAETILEMIDRFFLHLHGSCRYLPIPVSHVQLLDKHEGSFPDKCRSFARRKKRYMDCHNGIRGAFDLSAGLYSHFILGHTNFIVGSLLRRWDLLPSRFIGSDGS